jgi:hypothetical protein
MSMVTHGHLASINRADRDLYAREKVLNSAIIAADTSSGWEEYLEIFDAFYADHVEVSDDGRWRGVWQGADPQILYESVQLMQKNQSSRLHFGR